VCVTLPIIIIFILTPVLEYLSLSRSMTYMQCNSISLVIKPHLPQIRYPWNTPWRNATMVYSCTCGLICDRQDYNTVISSSVARNTQTVVKLRNTNNRLISLRCFLAHESSAVELTNQGCCMRCLSMLYHTRWFHPC
jgi:hypothetical protein